MGGATKWTPVLSPAYTFQSTLPVGGSDCSIGRLSRYSLSFQIHAPRRGSDLLISETPSPLHNFNPRSPQGERQCRYADFNAIRYFNPRSPQGERLPVTVHLCRLIAISIHAPRRGSDLRRYEREKSTSHISIHAPRRGSDGDITRKYIPTYNISIHAPRRGSDQMSLIIKSSIENFNPRSPQGERRYIVFKGGDDNVHFNPRSPQGERRRPHASSVPHRDFNPRSPQGERHYVFGRSKHAYLISIHAPRRGSDIQHSSGGFPFQDFNPRSPQGERQMTRHSSPGLTGFQSTLPAGGATANFASDGFGLMEFQSTLPAGGATRASKSADHFGIISIHAPRRGSDGTCIFECHCHSLFQSTLPAGGATMLRGHVQHGIEISIHAPRRGSD